MSVEFEKPTVFQAWGQVGEKPHLLVHEGECKSFMIEEGDVALFSIRGSSWNEVMQAYYDIQGWGEYDPMD